jgi:hypothetical protein
VELLFNARPAAPLSPIARTAIRINALSVMRASCFREETVLLASPIRLIAQPAILPNALRVSLPTMSILLPALSARVPSLTVSIAQIQQNVLPAFQTLW